MDFRRRERLKSEFLRLFAKILTQRDSEKSRLWIFPKDKRYAFGILLRPRVFTNHFRCDSVDMGDNITILAIETSCDETSAAVVSGGRICRSNIIASQIDTHSIYGGVVPEIASRKHVECIDSVVSQAMEVAGTSFADLDALAVTNGPGLAGALLVGVSYAKALAYSLDKPLVAVNHIEAHICSNYINNPAWQPPFVCLIASGGHTVLAYVKQLGGYEVLGQTLDDAAGEAFDKIARTLGLGYPGGPAVEKAALYGRPDAVTFPRALEGSLDFSFSGLKSSVINFQNSRGRSESAISSGISDEDVSASFQAAVIDVLVEKAVAACESTGCRNLALAGGVAASKALRQKLFEICSVKGIFLNVPEAELCTDNAAMVAAAAYYSYLEKRFAGLGLGAYATGLGS